MLLCRCPARLFFILFSCHGAPGHTLHDAARFAIVSRCYYAELAGAIARLLRQIMPLLLPAHAMMLRAFDAFRRYVAAAPFTRPLLPRFSLFSPPVLPRVTRHAYTAAAFATSITV